MGQNNSLMQVQAAIASADHTVSVTSVMGSVVDKKTLINVLGGVTAEKLSSIVGNTLDIVGFSVKPVDIVDKDTGEIICNPSTVIICADGQSYYTSSKGILNFLSVLVDLMGAPDEWEEPCRCRVKMVSAGRGNMFTLELV